MSSAPAGKVISTILRHDDMQTSYKIALLRGINDVVLNFPALDAGGRNVAVPLSLLADFWIAYYWAFVDPKKPIFQGPRALLDGSRRNDMAFRPQLTLLRREWEQLHGTSSAADGFFLMNELRIGRKRKLLPEELLSAYRKACRKVARTIRMPIRYAGPDQWTVFPKPKRFAELRDRAVAVPGTKGNQACLLVRSDLWKSFRQLSLWVEALCIHEWCLFTESVEQEEHQGVDRGDVYRRLTDRPDNRVALTWERNRIDVLLMEGRTFVCPWTEKQIRRGDTYDLDHLLPLSVYPINELWNLVPADPIFNTQKKRDRLPSVERLSRARPHLSHAYALYNGSEDLSVALREDVSVRFAEVDVQGSDFPEDVAGAATRFIRQVAESRNLARFS